MKEKENEKGKVLRIRETTPRSAFADLLVNWQGDMG